MQNRTSHDDRRLDVKTNGSLYGSTTEIKIDTQVITNQQINWKTDSRFHRQTGASLAAWRDLHDPTSSQQPHRPVLQSREASLLPCITTDEGCCTTTVVIWKQKRANVYVVWPISVWVFMELSLDIWDTQHHLASMFFWNILMSHVHLDYYNAAL